MWNNWKTYTMSVCLVIAGGLYYQGYITETTYKALEGVFLGGGLAALRHGIATTGGK